MARSRFKDWQAYQYAFKLAVSIFRLTSTFPKEEKYSLTDQIRRSSRSVCANLAEAYGRRQYEKHFKAKLYDCISENQETQVWLDFALEFKYLDINTHKKYLAAAERIGRILSYMVNNIHKFT